MSSIRKVSEKTSRRKRECFFCGHDIHKGKKYKLIEIRYDTTIISLYKCLECWDCEILNLEHTFFNYIKKFGKLININYENSDARND